MPSPGLRLVTAALLVLALALLALASHGVRKTLIRAIFLDSHIEAPPPALPLPPGPARPGLTQVARVRVVLIDGLGLDTARRLPALSALCARGHDLAVDTGFPTVSLAVQQVLWTGLTQQQSGILFRGKAEILADLAQRPGPGLGGGIPAQVPGSRAVAESHPYIVHALGFAQVQPAAPDGPQARWTEAAFVAAARAAVSSDARLVLVHILRVDTAGHRSGGRDSTAYQEAARTADRLLGELVAAESAAHGAGTRWLVLSDHGHRGQGLYGRGGGHGSAQPAIRLVRGCIAGELGTAERLIDGPLHLVDVARALADSLGVGLPAASAGRPLQAAAAAPAPGATLPAPPAGRWLAALALMLAACAATAWAARGHGWQLVPWWWPVALAAVHLLIAPPSLAVPMVYPPLGREVYLSALPGLVLMAALAARGLTRAAAVRVVVAQMALPVAGALAALVLASGTGVLGVVTGAPGEPPLMPRWTAYASVLLVLVYAGAVLLAAAVSASAARQRLEQRRRPCPPAAQCRAARGIATTSARAAWFEPRQDDQYRHN